MKTPPLSTKRGCFCEPFNLRKRKRPDHDHDLLIIEGHGKKLGGVAHHFVLNYTKPGQDLEWDKAFKLGQDFEWDKAVIPDQDF